MRLVSSLALCRYKRFMAGLPKRDLQSEVAKHFKGTPAERFIQARNLGRRAFQLLLANLPPGTTDEEAHEIFRRATRYGRVPSRAAGARPRP